MQGFTLGSCDVLLFKFYVAKYLFSMAQAFYTFLTFIVVIVSAVAKLIFIYKA